MSAATPATGWMTEAMEYEHHVGRSLIEIACCIVYFHTVAAKPANR